MAIDTKRLSQHDIQALLHLREGHFSDGKRISIIPSKLTKTIAAMFNADGGDVYIGLAEKPDKTFDWEGFRTPEDANAHLQIFEQLFPLGTGFSFTFLQHPTKSDVVLHVQINKGNRIVKASDGVPYVRRGAQNLPVTTPESLRVLELNKGLLSFENEAVNTSLSLVTESDVLGSVNNHFNQMMKEAMVTKAAKWEASFS